MKIINMRVLTVIIFIIGFLLLTGITSAAQSNTSVSYLPDEGKILIRNEITWIKIDPVSDHIVGDQFTVIGTTNLPVGSKIIGEIYTLPPNCPKNCSIDLEKYGIHKETFVISGSSNNLNGFSVTFNTSGLVSDVFAFRIGSDAVDYTTSITLFPDKSRNTIYSIYPSHVSSSEIYSIIIDTTENEKYYTRQVPPCLKLTGLTSLPAGVTISYSIISDVNLYRENSEKNLMIPIVQNRGYVIPGEKGHANRIFVDIDASQLDPGYYRVFLWNPEFNGSVSNDFLSTSIGIRLVKETSNASSISCPIPQIPFPEVSPTIQPALSHSVTPAVPLSVTGTFVALFGTGIVLQVARRIRMDKRKAGPKK
ncbi:MAG: hypothetical protein Q7U51_09645 [Methanoregula sp.]|nr:hypothetical protein [Methanoregula sp.]